MIESFSKFFFAITTRTFICCSLPCVWYESFPFLLTFLLTENNILSHSSKKIIWHNTSDLNHSSSWILFERKTFILDVFPRIEIKKIRYRSLRKKGKNELFFFADNEYHYVVNIYCFSWQHIWRRTGQSSSLITKKWRQREESRKVIYILYNENSSHSFTSISFSVTWN